MGKMNSTRPSYHSILKEELEKLEQRPSLYRSNSTIFMVPSFLRSVGKGGYEPWVVSLGPYHRGKEDLQNMEDRKPRFLRNFLLRVGASLDECMNKMKEMKDRAKQCYAKRINMSDDKFTEMLLLDGCFILELLLYPNNVDYSHKILAVRRDMTLLENQIPFFILEELLRLDLKTRDSYRLDGATAILEGLFYRFFEGHLANFDVCGDKINFNYGNDQHHQVHSHLLDLLRSWLVPSDHAMDNIINGSYKQENGDRVWKQNIPKARELQEAGIKFKVMRVKSGPLKVKFSSGILEMSRLQLCNESMIIIRNLIAYEQCTDSVGYVGDYVRFIDYLIDTPEDVAVLCQSKILGNGLASDKELANRVHLLCKYANWYPEEYSLRGLFDDLNKHCERKWPRYKALLMHNYFASPWSVISLLAAAVLLLLTLLQTIYTMLSYDRDKPSP